MAAVRSLGISAGSPRYPFDRELLFVITGKDSLVVDGMEWGWGGRLWTGASDLFYRAFIAILCKCMPYAT